MRVSIITRAFDRLEYTIRCLNGVRDNAGYDDYEHIVVDQGSRDGTREWLDWIGKMPNHWFERVRVIHLRSNSGDFGGMKEGYRYASGELIMQLDNDVYMKTEGWLAKMVHAYRGLDAQVLMADRSGYQEKVPYDEGTLRKIDYRGEELLCARIGKAVSCYLIGRGVFEERYRQAKHCRKLTAVERCWKTLSVLGHHMEGYDPANGSYVQHDKYGFQAPRIYLSRRFIFKHGRRKAP